MLDKLMHRLAVLTGLVVLLGIANQVQAAEKKPNILVITIRF